MYNKDSSPEFWETCDKWVPISLHVFELNIRCTIPGSFYDISGESFFFGMFVKHFVSMVSLYFVCVFWSRFVFHLWCMLLNVLTLISCGLLIDIRFFVLTFFISIFVVNLVKIYVPFSIALFVVPSVVLVVLLVAAGWWKLFQSTFVGLS